MAIYPYGKKKPIPEESPYAAAAAALGGAVIGTTQKPQETQARPVAKLATGAISSAAAPLGAPSIPTSPAVTPLPISDNVKSLMDALTAKASSGPVTSEQVMESPEYTNQANAIDALAAKDMGVLRSGLLGDFASRGMLRSTPANQTVTSALGDITLKANAQKAALIPSMIQAAESRRQQDIQNAAMLLSQALGIENNYFNQGLSEAQFKAPYEYLTKGQQVQSDQWQQGFDYNKGQDAKSFSLSEANVTGRYRPAEMDSLIDAIISAKKANALGQDAQRKAIADKARADLSSRYGVDANKLFGSDVTLEQAIANRDKAYILTPQARQNEIDASGVDPVTGKMSPSRTLQELQIEREQRQSGLDKLKADIAANPLYGLTAQAKMDIQKAEKELQRVDADIAASYALANQRSTTDTSKANETVKKEFDTKVTALRSDYNFSLDGARTWQKLLDLWQPDDNGYIPSVQEKQQDLAEAIKGNMPDLDRALLTLLFQSYYMGNQTAQQSLMKEPYRKRDITGE